MPSRDNFPALILITIVNIYVQSIFQNLHSKPAILLDTTLYNIDIVTVDINSALFEDNHNLPHPPPSPTINYFEILLLSLGPAARPPPQWVMAASFTRSLDHTQRRTIVGRTPLHE